jgi:catechol 2,3-dioxygenase-like lactoylglutathione lyase family enzyme
MQRITAWPFLGSRRMMAMLNGEGRRINRKRVQRLGSAPWSLDDGKLNDRNGGRGVYFRDPDGHVLELMTVPQ